MRPEVRPPAGRRPLGILIVGLFAFIAGIGEVIVGFTGNYLVILAHSIPPSIATAVVGAFYSVGGLFLLFVRRKWGAIIGVLFIGAEILGRAYLILAGIAPAVGADAIKILVGALIAAAIIIYVLTQWKRIA